MERRCHNQRQDTVQQFQQIDNECVGMMQDLEAQLEEVKRLQGLANMPAIPHSVVERLKNFGTDNDGESGVRMMAGAMDSLATRSKFLAVKAKE
jgi:hypothetical protein